MSSQLTAKCAILRYYRFWAGVWRSADLLLFLGSLQGGIDYVVIDSKICGSATRTDVYMDIWARRGRTVVFRLPSGLSP
jgi:hypothetical protein